MPTVEGDVSLQEDGNLRIDVSHLVDPDPPTFRPSCIYVSPQADTNNSIMKVPVSKSSGSLVLSAKSLLDHAFRRTIWICAADDSEAVSDFLPVEIPQPSLLPRQTSTYRMPRIGVLCAYTTGGDGDSVKSSACGFTGIVMVPMLSWGGDAIGGNLLFAVEGIAAVRLYHTSTRGYSIVATGIGGSAALRWDLWKSWDVYVSVRTSALLDGDGISPRISAFGGVLLSSRSFGDFPIFLGVQRVLRRRSMHRGQ